MEEGGFKHMEEGGGFMELLGSGGEVGGGYALFDGPSSLPSPSSSSYYSSLTPAQMLCFAAKEEEEEEEEAAAAAALPVLHGVVLVQRSSENSSLSSSVSSSPPSTNINSSSSSRSSKKGGGRSGRRSTSVTTTPATIAASKKPKTEGFACAGHGTIKVRKEKLGDRIMALQQLVSPFGKSDTASVLHEALGYIRFLHDQVQVLSSPYLQQGLPNPDHIRDGGGEKNDLRSRGLCLVPVACTQHVTSGNGADLWSPAMGVGKSSSSSNSKH